MVEAIWMWCNLWPFQFWFRVSFIFALVVFGAVRILLHTAHMHGTTILQWPSIYICIRNWNRPKRICIGALDSITSIAVVLCLICARLNLYIIVRITCVTRFSFHSIPFNLYFSNSSFFCSIPYMCGICVVRFPVYLWCSALLASYICICSDNITLILFTLAICAIQCTGLILLFTCNIRRVFLARLYFVCWLACVLHTICIVSEDISLWFYFWLSNFFFLLPAMLCVLYKI